MHIDFGFAFTTSPGNLNFERAPFKLTKEYAQILGGLDSELFVYFKILLAKGLTVLTKPENLNKLKALLIICAKYSNLSCFKNFRMSKFLKRFQVNLDPVQVI